MFEKRLLSADLVQGAEQAPCRTESAKRLGVNDFLLNR
jgi:hypothetical protein